MPYFSISAMKSRWVKLLSAEVQNRGLFDRKFAGLGVQVGEIAAPAAGDADLLGWMAGLFEQQHRAAALAGDACAHQAGGAGAEDDDIMEIRWRMAGLRHSTSSTSTATASFCLRDPTMMPSTGETSEKSRPTARMM